MKKQLKYLSRIACLLVGCFFSASQPVAACSCGKISSVKANMHNLQTLLETFGVDHHFYPGSVRTLEAQARRHSSPYWKDFVNPMTSQMGYLKSFADLPLYRLTEAESQAHYAEVLGLRFLLIEPQIPENTAGLVLYDYVSKHKYFIYGLDKKGEFIKDKGQIFTLSNS
ncbi:MAG: hypothetical protein AB7I41_16885 [Candidatus Sericytochromatia bacterium]